MTPPLPPLDPKVVSLLWAGPDRAAEISQMQGRLFPDAWDAPGVMKLLEHPASTAFVAQIGAPKITVGYVLGQVMADEAEILSLGVAPELQRRGLGRLLVQGLIRAVKKAEARTLFLEVAADNAAAVQLYSKLSFTETGRRKAYYARNDGSAVDALTMSVIL